MIKEIGNRTNLVLDPDLDSYYMIDTIVNQVPEIHEALMRWQWLRESNAPKEEQAKYEGLISIHLIPNVYSNLRNVQQEDKNFYEEGAGLQTQLSRWLNTLSQYPTELSETNRATNQTEIHDFCTSIGEGASREIEDLLNTRILHYKGMRQQAWCYTILVLGLQPLFSIVLVRSTTAPINRLIEATCKAAKDGDLAQRVVVSGKDEIAELSQSFNLMVETLDMMVNRVQNSGFIVTSSAKEIAGVAKQQQATSAEIAATTLEIEATSKEISATTKQLSKTMQEVHEVAEGTASLAGEGQDGLIKMRETMQGIMTASGSISSKLSVLNERATKINSVITTINKVADQTNLLSLNAAIEAEKAGEYGQGFAVVAREIRRLADQTAVATFDIEQMVKEMQSSVSTGVMGMERFTDEVKRGVQDVESVSSQLGEIINQVQTLTPRFDSVSEGMQSQVLGAQQISEGLGQLSTAVQQTADSLMQSNHSIERLNEAAGGLKHGVERFKLSQNTRVEEVQ